MNNNYLVVLLPAYNEEKDVERLVRNWQQYEIQLREEYQLTLKIVIVNDGSTDRTKKIVNELMREYDNVLLLDHDGNQGLGAAVNSAFLYGLKKFKRDALFCLMDCDNTQDPCYVFDMIEKMKKDNSDVVIASRYEGDAKVHGLAKYREIASIGARYIYSGTLRVPYVKDYTCGYRLYKGSILVKAYEHYKGSFVSETGFTCMAEVLYKLHSVGAKFSEIGFELHYDYKAGDSKMQVVKTAIRSIRLCLGLRFKVRRFTCDKKLKEEY